MMTTTSSLLLRLPIRPPSAIPFTTTTHYHHHHRHHRLSSNAHFPTTNLRFKPTQTLTLTRKPLKITNSYNSSATTPVTDRLISTAAYCLPLLNGLPFGRFLFSQYPIVAAVFQPIFPIHSLFHSIPFANFVVFFGLYLGVVRNQTMSRYVRFNSMQALVFDVLLAIPSLVMRILSPGGGGGGGSGGLGLKVMMAGHSGVFVVLAACCLYSICSCILGNTPYLPIVADAAGRQV